jgi:hypothetical protein
MIVSTPKNSRIPLGIVSVLASTMLATERLDRLRGAVVRACRRLAASSSVRPVRAGSVSVVIR